MSIEKTMCEAMSIIAEQYITSANFDKTIQAQIIECTDSVLHKYKLSYQNATIIAYATDGSEYAEDTLVYVKIPSNDFKQTKIITGAVSPGVSSYSLVKEESDKYEDIGTGIFSENTNYSLSSYFSRDSKGIDCYKKILYDKSLAKNSANFAFSEEEIKYCFENATHIKISSNIKTQLPLEQQSQGNYGITVRIAYQDETNVSNTVLKNFIFNIDDITGNPYLLSEDFNQEVFLELGSKNFLYIDSIWIWAEDFPNQESEDNEDVIDDIFFYNIQITPVKKYSETELNGGIVSFITPQGISFSKNDSNTSEKTIEAYMKINGAITYDGNLRYFWFKENNSVTAASNKYCSYGGIGWECLNSYRVWQDGLDITEKWKGHESEYSNYTIEWIPNLDNTYSVKKESIYTNSIKYKCVILYNDTVYSSEIQFNRYDSPYELKIISDNGFTFYDGAGAPRLSCQVYRGGSEIIDYSQYSFIWTDTDSNGKSLSSLINSSGVSEEKSSAYDIIDETVSNEIIANISAIESFHKFKCTVLEKNSENSIGSVTVTIYNKGSNLNTFRLNIKNGVKTFKYNADDIAPTSESLKSPMKLESLSFIFTDPEGREISAEDIVKMGGSILWKVPYENTMLLLNETAATMEDGYAYIENQKELPYKISSSYIENATFNNIELQVTYKGNILTAQTNFSFIKEGQSGTNGTDCVLQIVPNKEFTSEYPTLFYDGSNPCSCNFTSSGKVNLTNDTAKSSSWFKARIMKGGEVLNEYMLNEKTDVTWEMVGKNKKGVATNFDILSYDNHPYLSYNNNVNSNICNILRASVNHNNYTYRAELPILLSKTLNSSGYTMKLKEHTGFTSVMYKDDGTSPAYTAIPFEIELYYNGNLVDLASSSSYTFEWNVIQGAERYSATEKQFKNNETYLYIEELSTDDARNLRVEINKAYSNNNISALLTELNQAISSNKSQYEINQKRNAYNNALNKFKAEELEIKNKYADSQLTYRRTVSPKDTFISESVTNAIYVVVKNSSGTSLASLLIPVYMYLNRYGKNAINGWDGNSININDEEGIILAPQVGAGKIESDNSFTGALMGTVRDSSSDKTGIFGYFQGKQSFFLNSKDGSAHLGYGDSTIDIEPRTASNGGLSAIIRGGGYTSTSRKGLEINLTKPSIKYGNGNFIVDENGYLTATGANFKNGTISITDNNENTIFKVDSSGYLTMTKGKISLGETKVTKVPVFQVDDNGYLTIRKENEDEKTTKPTDEATEIFKVYNSGLLKVGEWRIDQNKLYALSKPVGDYRNSYWFNIDKDGINYMIYTNYDGNGAGYSLFNFRKDYSEDEGDPYIFKVSAVKDLDSPSNGEISIFKILRTGLFFNFNNNYFEIKDEGLLFKFGNDDNVGCYFEIKKEGLYFKNANASTTYLSIYENYDADAEQTYVNGKLGNWEFTHKGINAWLKNDRNVDVAYFEIALRDQVNGLALWDRSNGVDNKIFNADLKGNLTLNFLGVDYQNAGHIYLHRKEGFALYWKERIPKDFSLSTLQGYCFLIQRGTEHIFSIDWLGRIFVGCHDDNDNYVGGLYFNNNDGLKYTNGTKGKEIFKVNSNGLTFDGASGNGTSDSQGKVIISGSAISAYPLNNSNTSFNLSISNGNISTSGTITSTGDISTSGTMTSTGDISITGATGKLCVKGASGGIEVTNGYIEAGQYISTDGYIFSTGNISTTNGQIRTTYGTIYSGGSAEVGSLSSRDSISANGKISGNTLSISSDTNINNWNISKTGLSAWITDSSGTNQAYFCVDENSLEVWHITDGNAAGKCVFKVDIKNEKVYINNTEVTG